MLKATAVCDQVQLFREGIARVLDPSKFQVALSVRSLDEVVTDTTVKSELDLIIVGISDDFALENTLRLLGSLTENDPMTIVLATSPTRALIRAAMQSGIRAVLSKDISGEVLSRALELVLLGQKFFPAYDDVTEDRPDYAGGITPASISAAAERLQIRLPSTSDDDIQLSEREEQILCRLVAGAPNKTIARDLAITDATVKVHIKGLLRKLRVTNRTQAAIWGVNHGFSDKWRGTKRVNGSPSLGHDIHATS